MADQWHQFTFSELISTRALEIGDGYRAKISELGGNGPIFLRAGHVTDTHIDFVGADRFHASRVSAMASKMSRPGDVIITTKGNSTGRVAFVDSTMPIFVYSPHLSYARVSKSTVKFTVTAVKRAQAVAKPGGTGERL